MSKIPSIASSSSPPPSPRNENGDEHQNSAATSALKPRKIGQRPRTSSLQKTPPRIFDKKGLELGKLSPPIVSSDPPPLLSVRFQDEPDSSPPDLTKKSPEIPKTRRYSRKHQAKIKRHSFSNPEEKQIIFEPLPLTSPKKTLARKSTHHRNVSPQPTITIDPAFLNPEHSFRLTHSEKTPPSVEAPPPPTSPLLSPRGKLPRKTQVIRRTICPEEFVPFGQNSHTLLSSIQDCARSILNQPRVSLNETITPKGYSSSCKNMDLKLKGSGEKSHHLFRQGPTVKMEALTKWALKRGVPQKNLQTFLSSLSFFLVKDFITEALAGLTAEEGKNALPIGPEVTSLCTLDLPVVSDKSGKPILTVAYTSKWQVMSYKNFIASSENNAGECKYNFGFFISLDFLSTGLTEEKIISTKFIGFEMTPVSYKITLPLDV